MSLLHELEGWWIPPYVWTFCCRCINHTFSSGQSRPHEGQSQGMGSCWSWGGLECWQNCPQEVRPEMTWQAFLRHAIQTKEYCSSIWFYYDFMPWVVKVQSCTNHLSSSPELQDGVVQRSFQVTHHTQRIAGSLRIEDDSYVCNSFQMSLELR